MVGFGREEDITNVSWVESYDATKGILKGSMAMEEGS